MTVHDRFQVGCECCGLLRTFRRLSQALEYARKGGHTKVLVFDLMARYGRPTLWAPNGRVISLRVSRPGRVEPPPGPSERGQNRPPAGAIDND